jgi:kumamolisin
MARSVRLRVGAGLAAGVTAAAIGTAAAAASASTGPGPNTLVKVQPGMTAAALPRATVFGNTPASTPETVSFILRERQLPELEASVAHGVKKFLSVGQFAGEYGQSPSVISGLESYLAKFGITTKAYADGIDVSAQGTAGEFDQALSVSQKQYRVPAFKGKNGQTVPAQTVHAATSAPELPERIAGSILTVLGLTNYSPFASQTAHINTKFAKTAVHKASANTSSSTPKNDPAFCEQLSGLPSGCHIPSDFASSYGLDNLYKAGADGAGQALAIVTLAAVDPNAPQYFWQNVAGIPDTGRTLTVDNIDGGPGAPSDAAGSGESDLDVEQSGALAPGANVIVYQAPNTDAGFADAFFQAASDNTASTVSASWGESETYLQAAVAAGVETPLYETAFDEAFLEMAAQGQSGFIASGDEGAYTASNPGDLGTTNLSVGASADSPYITAAGGTTLPWTAEFANADGSVTATVNVTQQRTWGWDYLWQPIATVSGVTAAQVAPTAVVGSGGGFSTFEPRPSYQDDVPGIGHYHAVPYLTPTDYQTITGTNLSLPTSWSVNTSPGVVTGYSNGRAVPDVSADADPYSGYLLYEPSAAAAGGAALQGGWGGTSFVAPQLNGSAAVIDSYLGHRVGFWNPAIYKFATNWTSPFTSLSSASTSNDNIYYTGNPGSVYNEGSGLGFPNLAKLATDFKHES